MNIKDVDWKKAVETVASAIATAFGGPLSAVSQAVLGKPNGTDAEITQAVASASPEVLAALKEAGMTFAARMKELDIDLERIGAGDRDSARLRDVELAKTGRRNIRHDVLAYAAVGGFFICLYVLLTRALPDGAARDTVLILIGLLVKVVSDVYGYDFGSSSGSAQKTDMIDLLSGKSG